MSQDQIERDRLLTEVHTNVSHLVKNFNTHVESDEINFKNLKKRVFWLTIAMVIIGMIVGGPELLTVLLK